MEKEGVAEAVVSLQILPKSQQPSADPSEQPWSDRMIRSEMTRNPESWMIDYSPRPRWKYPCGLMMKAIWTAATLRDNQSYRDYVQIIMIR